MELTVVDVWSEADRRERGACICPWREQLGRLYDDLGRITLRLEGKSGDRKKTKAKECYREHGSNADHCAVHSGQTSTEWTFPSSEKCVPVLTHAEQCIVKDKTKKVKLTLRKSYKLHWPYTEPHCGIWGKLCGHVDNGHGTLSLSETVSSPVIHQRHE